MHRVSSHGANSLPPVAGARVGGGAACGASGVKVSWPDESAGAWEMGVFSWLVGVVPWDGSRRSALR
jgi:hypothetical protein